MKLGNNEKGITLVEVLAAVVILSIILVSVMNFFQQMGFMNKQNEDKLQAINTAKQVLVKWENSEEIRQFLMHPSTDISDPSLVDRVIDDPDYFIFLKDHGEGEFQQYIKIKKSSDISTDPTKAYRIQVELNNDQGKLITKTYGYIILK